MPHVPHLPWESGDIYKRFSCRFPYKLQSSYPSKYFFWGRSCCLFIVFGWYVFRWSEFVACLAIFINFFSPSHWKLAARPLSWLECLPVFLFSPSFSRACLLILTSTYIESCRFQRERGSDSSNVHRKSSESIPEVFGMSRRYAIFKFDKEGTTETRTLELWRRILIVFSALAHYST